MSTVSAQRRDVAKKAALAARLKSIEGQARGIERMLEEDRSCLEIIDQLAALRGATQAVCLQALEVRLPSSGSTTSIRPGRPSHAGCGTWRMSESTGILGPGAYVLVQFLQDWLMVQESSRTVAG